MITTEQARGIGHFPAARQPSARVIWSGIGLALVAAAVSLLITAAANSDPLVWVMWARQLTGPGHFDTWNGPAWHPLPVLLLAPFTLITRGGVDIYYWLLIARFGAALLVLVGALLAYRFGGAWAALLAVLLLVISTWWLDYGTEGAGEPMLAALLGAALLADDRGHDRVAAGLCVAAALVRPEAWPFIALYFLYLISRRSLSLWWALLAAAGVLVCWAIPNLLNAGQGAFAAAKSAPNAFVAAHAAFPFGAVLALTRQQLTTPVAALAAVGIALVIIAMLRARSAVAGPSQLEWLLPTERREWLLTLFGLGWILVIALMAELRIATGSPRYLLPGTAALTIEAAIVAVRLTQGAVQAAAGRRPITDVVTAVVVVVVAALSLAQSRSWLSSAVALMREHVAWTPQIKHDLTTLRCPGRYWTGLGYAAWLALASDQTLQQSQAHGSTRGLRRAGVVVCAPRHPPPIR